MKRKIAKGLMAASVLICCLFLVKEVVAGRFFPLYETETESVSVPPRTVKSLSVSSEQTDVKIIAEARNDISANVTGPAGKMFVRSRGKTLDLKAKEKGFQFLNLFQRPLLIVRIPYDYHQDITVRSSSGSIAFDGNRGLSLSHLGVRTVSGNMSLKHVKTDVFEAKGLSGDLAAADLAAKTADVRLSSGNVGLHHVSGPLDVRVASGSVDASLETANAPVSVRLASGSAAISLPKDGSFTVNAETASGRIQPSYSFEKTSKEGGAFTGIKGSGARMIDIKVTSGNIALQ
ncbi:LiaG family protein [Bacillus amyloliquefaciens]|uniref:LiaG family protein n=1 Tax=Bacillus amyloliquefaciens TaxID=1390 RepID=UPI003C717567